MKEKNENVLAIECFAYEAVKEYDWSMNPYIAEDYNYDYTEYENECMDIGHDYREDIECLVKERLIKAGKLSENEEQYNDAISEIVWNEISGAISSNVGSNIIYRKGNLLEARADIICHQVNCMGKMGAGIAKQIRDKYPKVYEGYKELCEKMAPQILLGSVDFEKTDHYIVANCFAQLGYAYKGLQTNYEALKTCLETVKEVAEKDKILSIALPYKIGCGLAHGDWDKVETIIKEVFEYKSNITVQIIEFEKQCNNTKEENVCQIIRM